MRIQHNIMAMNSYRNYNNNTSAVSKNLEKLSSGYKINRAGDDAAGLAISEKMRAQITGLKARFQECQGRRFLVNTAEGALQEVHMLNRMDYLATQSANGTYDNDVDRLNLQKEVKALQSEIDRSRRQLQLQRQSPAGRISVRHLRAFANNIDYKANGIKNIEVTGGKLTGLTQEETAFSILSDSSLVS